LFQGAPHRGVLQALPSGVTSMCRVL